jgi:LigD-like primase-polymerase
MVVSDMKKNLRTGKVFVDWSQNDEHKTTVAVYSLRARERPTVSTPVTWEEVERAFKKKDANLLVFEAPQTVKRVGKMGDLFSPLLVLKQRLPDLKQLAQSAAAEEQEPISLAAEAEETSKTARKQTARKQIARKRAPAKTSRKDARRPPARKSRRKV